MRVALLAPRFLPHAGGVETHVHRLAAGLVTLGCEVEVLTQERASAAPALERRDGYAIRRFAMRPANDTYPFAPGLVRHLRRRRDLELVHSHSYHALPALAGAAAARAPTVFTPHYHGGGHSPLARALHRPYRPAGAFVLRRARRIICVSAAESQLLVEHFPATHPRIRAIPNGVDRAAIQDAEPLPGEPPTVLVVGRLERYKRVDRVLDALPALPGHQLVVVGDGPEREALERQARDRGIAGRVRFEGRVGDDELHRWLRTAAVLVSLSEHEAFGLAPAEALVAGTPVVASDIPAHRVVLGPFAPGPVRLVPHDLAPEALAHELAAVDRPAPGVAGALADWSEVAARTLAVYEEAVAA